MIVTLMYGGKSAKWLAILRTKRGQAAKHCPVHRKLVNIRSEAEAEVRSGAAVARVHIHTIGIGCPSRRRPEIRLRRSLIAVLKSKNLFMTVLHLIVDVETLDREPS